MTDYDFMVIDVASDSPEAVESMQYPNASWQTKLAHAGHPRQHQPQHDQHNHQTI